MQDRSLKIYKPQDIEGLLNIDKLKLKTDEECEKLIEETRIKCATLEKETYETALNKLHVEQLQLFEQNHKKVDEFFNNSQQDLNDILKVVYDKIKMDENSVKILTNLLFAEVDKLKIKSNKFTVYANVNVLSLLQANIKEEYAGNDNVSFDYDIKQELRSEECMIESDYVMARISVADFQEKVLKVLFNSHID